MDLKVESHGTVIVGHHGWPTRKSFNSRRSRMAKTVKFWLLTKTRNDLKQPTEARNDLKWPTTSRAQPTMIWTYLQRAKKRRETTNNKQILKYFTIWGKRFSSLARFPPNIWLQSSEHYIIENHGENRASSIYLRDIGFVFFCLGFLSIGKGRGYYFSSTCLADRLVFSVCIYGRFLMMNEDFTSRSRYRTSFSHYQNLYKNK